MRWETLLLVILVGVQPLWSQEPERGAIAGTVMTVEGDPVDGAVVKALASSGATGEAVSDDRGMFRVFGLSAGTYKLQVQAGAGSIEAGGELTAWSYPVGAREAEDVIVEDGTTAGAKDFVLPQVGRKDRGTTGEQVSGRVEEWTNGAGIAGALVTLKDGDASLASRTDRAGVFRFARVPVGSYEVSVWSAGHLKQVPGRLTVAAGSRVVKVEVGSPVKDVRVRLLRNGVLTGRVDAEGKPVVRAMVSANSLVTTDGKRGLEQAGSAFTDDRGEFRVSGLAPGTYYVAAAVGASDEKQRAPAPTFFPGTVRFGDAVSVHVPMEGEPVAVNLEMPIAKKRRVSGTVRVPEGATALQVRLRPRDPVLAIKFGEKAAEVDAKTGTFKVIDVWPGEYEVIGVAQTGEVRLSGSAVVNVRQGDEEGLQVVLTPLLRVRGDVRSEGEPSCITSGAVVQVWSRGGDGGSAAHAAVLQDGTFTLEDVQPGSYRVSVSGLMGTCYAKGFLLGAVDVDAESVPLTEVGLTIQVVLRSDGRRVRGAVVDSQGKGVGGKGVLMVAAGTLSGRTELTKTAVTDNQGNYLLQGVGPGSYDIFELSDEMEDVDAPTGMPHRIEVQAGEDSFVRLVEADRQGRL